jgi:site-specific recombinase XerD
LAGLAEAFLEATAHQYLPNTLRAYRYDLRLLAEALPGKAAAAVTTLELRAFLHAMAELSPATLARRRAALRSLFGWAQRNGWLQADPSAALETVRVPERQPRPLTERQAEALLAAIPLKERRNRLLFFLLYETGMRVGEALGVHAEHVFSNETDGGFVRVFGKGGRERVVPLLGALRTLRLLRQVLRQPGTVGPLFHGDPRKGGRRHLPLDYTTVFHHFERYLATARARRPELFAEEEPVTIHRLRHTYATLRLREGVSVEAVRKLMGHRNLQTTLGYAEADLQDVQRALLEARRRRGP